LSNLALGPEAGNLLRDESNGFIYLASHGVKHKFPTCTLVAEYYGACAGFINLPPERLAGFTTGSEMTQFLVSGSPPTTYFVSGTLKHRLHSLDSKPALADGGSTDAVSVPTFVTDSFSNGPDILVAGTLITIGEDPQEYLVTSPTTLTPISTILVAEFGFPPASTASAETFPTLTVSSSALTLAVTCDATTYVAGGGKIWPLPNAFGLPTTALDSSSCAALTTSTVAVTEALFLRNPNNGYIYNITKGKKKFMTTMAEVYAANNGSTTPVYIPTNQTILNSIPG
jgi:hypothetical protein